MSRITRKFVKTGNTADAVNAQIIHSTYTPTNYTPSAVGSENTVNVSAHLKGIDSAIGAIGLTPGDIGLTSFSAANNQSSPANVTGLAFANGTTRSFESLISISIDATTDLYAVYKILGIQKGSDWHISISYTGDDTGIEFSITSAGQVQYTSSNLSGFVSNTMKFRASTTTI